jgi:hypothetical protein
MGDISKAYETMAIGTKSIVFARTRAQARYFTVRAANDAGYKITFMDVQYARRRKEYDGMRQYGKCVAVKCLP